MAIRLALIDRRSDIFRDDAVMMVRIWYRPEYQSVIECSKLQVESLREVKIHEYLSTDARDKLRDVTVI